MLICARKPFAVRVAGVTSRGTTAPSSAELVAVSLASRAMPVLLAVTVTVASWPSARPVTVTVWVSPSSLNTTSVSAIGWPSPSVTVPLQSKPGAQPVIGTRNPPTSRSTLPSSNVNANAASNAESVAVSLASRAIPGLPAVRVTVASWPSANPVMRISVVSSWTTKAQASPSSSGVQVPNVSESDVTVANHS